MKKVLALVITAAIAFSVMAGCSKQQTEPAKPAGSTASAGAAVNSGPELIRGNIYSTGEKILKEKKTYKIAVAKDPNSQNGMGDKQIVKDAEEARNIHIEWMDIPHASWKEQVNILLASGNLPDAFCGSLELPIMQNLDSFQPIGDLINKYAPNAAQVLKDEPAVKNGVTAPDGKIYALPANKYNPSNQVDNMLWLNPDWLKKVGKNIPKTIDEFTDVLKAFKTGDPNGNGKQDELPLVSWENQPDEAANLHSIIGSFGALLPKDYVYAKKDNKVVFGGTEPGLLPAIKWLNSLYKDGLLDKETFTMDNAQLNAKAQSKDVIIGSITYWIPDSMDLKLKDYIVLDPLKGPGGAEPIALKGTEPPGANVTGYAITKACKDPEALLRYYDLNMKDMETIMIWQWGPKGAGLWKPVGADQWTQTTEFVPAGTNLTFFKRTICPSVNGPNYIPQKFSEKEVADDRNAKKREAAKRILPFTVQTKPKLLFDPQKETARNMLFTDIDNYMKKFFANGVVNGLSDAQWQEHLATCKKLKTEEYTKMWQEYFDAAKK